MIIGNGFLGRSFESYRGDSDVCIFASGVSNSSNRDNSLFEREQTLLEQTLVGNPEKILVYFSTCSIYDISLSESPYVLHKMAMEAIIQNSGNRYIIFRKSNIVWDRDDSTTLVNFLIKQIQTGNPFFVWQNATRNLIALDDFCRLVNHILQRKIMQNSIVNIANTTNYPMIEIVSILEEIIQKQWVYDIVNKGWSYDIETSYISTILDICGVHFSDKYIKDILREYYI